MAGQGVNQSQVRSFVGRQDDLSELRRLLAAGQRLITITAPGGYGKSRLAQHLCAVLSGNFAQGTAEVLLAPLADPSRLPGHLAQSLQLKLSGSGDPLAQLGDYLREKELLLHFDNFEHLLPGAPLVAELLAAAPKLRVIATSREALHLPGEYVYALDALPVETPAEAALNHAYSPAVQLFADRARLAQPDFFLSADNAPQVAEICATLEGVPLAIELAAAWSGEYALSELQHELRQQLDLAARDPQVPERHRSVRASCDWSYNLLNEEQQLVLRCLGVFRGGFFLDAGQFVIPTTDLRADLQALAGKNWLYVRQVLGRSRYFIHDAAIREYAYQRLLGSEDYDVAVQMHCRYFTQLLEEDSRRLHGAGQLQALQALAAEQENLYQALETALRQPGPEALPCFARCLPEYQLMVGEVRSCRSMCQELAARAQELGCPEAQQAALTGEARALLQLGQYDAAAAASRAARELAQRRGDRHGLAQCSLVLGEVARLEGEHATARFRYDEALELMRLAGATHDIADALHCLGRVEVTEGNYGVARTLIGESLELRQRSGDQHGAASSLNDLANIEYRAGNYTQARRLNSESLELRRRLGDRHGIAQSLHNLGNVEFGEGDYPAAWTLYSESLALKRDIGERFGIAASLNNLGNVEYCERNYHDARRLHEESLAIKREIRDRMGIAYSLGNLGNISVRLGEYARAAAELREGLATALELSSTENLLASLAIAAHLFAAQEQYRVGAILSAGVARLLPEAGLMLDPMDGGMLAEAAQAVQRELAPAALAELGQAAAGMDLPALVELCLAELGGAEAAASL